MRFYSRFLFLALFPAISLSNHADWANLPDEDYFKPYKAALEAPRVQGFQLRQGDRLAICGDSITEQKMYSRIMETYLTVCVPELEVTVRQFGWSGERAPGFLNRMTNDVLRFHPTIATTCYGMNDHRYQPFTKEIGETYQNSSRAVIQSFKSHGVRVIQGSPGTIGKMPGWVATASGTVTDLNLGLLELRNIDMGLALEQEVGFADVYLPMLIHGHRAQTAFGNDFMITGKDGVHPGWAGQTVMAFAFLDAMGLSGEIATIHWNLKTGEATVGAGHHILSSSPNAIQMESSRYPFCATGAEDKDDSIRAGMSLVGFNEKLNRFTLKISNPAATHYKLEWGPESRDYSAVELETGINLADEFHINPFSDAFNEVDKAVAAKQEYETRQVKSLFHGPEGRADMEMTVALTEKTRSPLAAAIAKKRVPVRHSLKLNPITGI